VWPEQLPGGDRIIEQMYYIPKGYKYLKTPIKRILIQTGAGAAWEKPKLNQGEFVGCPVSQCWLTLNQTLGPEVDAVLFRHSYSPPTYQRPPGQVNKLLRYSSSIQKTIFFNVIFLLRLPNGLIKFIYILYGIDNVRLPVSKVCC